MLGCQFARQKPIGRYIVDFYCPELRLVIEIDGESHLERFEEGMKRQKELEAMGLEMLRFADRKVKRGSLNVLRSIEGWIEERRKTSSDSRCRSAEGTTPCRFWRLPPFLMGNRATLNHNP